VCNKCDIEIDELDGDNYCPDCENSDTPPPPLKKKKTKTLSRADREEVYRDLGLVKVRGKLGGTYFE
jgi:hypothetical protein